MDPVITIIIPCYNAEKFVKKAVLSALNQTYKNTEVIAVDNESEDDTLKLLSSIKGDNDKLTVLSAKNKYPHCWDEAREAALSVFSGKYFTTLCADDILSRKYIEKYVKNMNKNPGFVVYQSPIRTFREDSQFYPGATVYHNYKLGEDFKEKCLKYCPVNSPTVMYDRVLLEQELFAPNPEEFSGAADYDLYCHFANVGIDIFSIPNFIGYYYRIHQDQVTWEMHKGKVNYDAKIQSKWRKLWKKS